MPFQPYQLQCVVESLVNSNIEHSTLLVEKHGCLVDGVLKE